MRLEKCQFKGLLAAFALLARFCEAGNFVEIRRGVTRCVHPSGRVIVELNLRLVLGDFSCVLPSGRKSVHLLKRLANTDGCLFIAATRDLTIVGDADTSVRLPKREADKTVKHVHIFRLEQAAGVDFSAPVFSVLVNKRMKATAMAAVKILKWGFLEFYARQGVMESAINTSQDMSIFTTLEPAMPVAQDADVEFKVPAKYIARVPANSILSVYLMNTPDRVLWEISGAVHKNPLVPFRVMGNSITPIS